METTYQQTPASSFAELIREPVKIWRYCGECWVRTYQTFHHEDDKNEYYECERCHTIHNIAVR